MLRPYLKIYVLVQLLFSATAFSFDEKDLSINLSEFLSKAKSIVSDLTSA